ncbi:MAG TPA: hypothetical protein PKW76_07445 [bacterium]|nr:hypothetical protein [bacterium]HPG45496.1 hypothetical protein [bacterium]HPM96728.1 hypothetical protein [bacterium]
MPSLMPGKAGTKEAYAIAVIGKDLRIAVPPGAMLHYRLQPDAAVLLMTTHRGEGGFALLPQARAAATVFAKYIDRIAAPEVVHRFQDKAYALTKLQGGRICLTGAMLQAFHLGVGARLLVVKSTTVALSYTPVEIWRAKFAQRGLHEAIENMAKLEVL